MAIEIKMPALSPTMEEGTLAKWLVKQGDAVKFGDILAEIETDKATMEFESADEGTIAKIAVPEGTDGVKVGVVIALMDADSQIGAAIAPELAASRGSLTSSPDRPGLAGEEPRPARDNSTTARQEAPAPVSPARAPAEAHKDDRVDVSPLARRIAAERNVELAAVSGSGSAGRILKADVDGASGNAGGVPSSVRTSAPPAPAPIPDVPHEIAALTSMRKTIARRLTQSKQQVPHIYLTVDVRVDKLLALRAELNDSLASRGVKLSVNDLMIKALAVALMQVPKCNVMYTPSAIVTFGHAEISVAVLTPEGLITPVITRADTASLSSISNRMKDLAARARDRTLRPEEYSGGTASISNLGMYGIKQFDAVINPPQGMILAVGAGEKRPWVMDDGSLGIATIVSATGSFDHRAIDGADGAQLMQAFKGVVERPLEAIT